MRRHGKTALPSVPHQCARPEVDEGAKPMPDCRERACCVAAAPCTKMPPLLSSRMSAAHDRRRVAAHTGRGDAPRQASETLSRLLRLRCLCMAARGRSRTCASVERSYGYERTQYEYAGLRTRTCAGSAQGVKKCRCLHHRYGNDGKQVHTASYICKRLKRRTMKAVN
eukprot:698329-Pleurochrysis_carterae.AAC.2